MDKIKLREHELKFLIQGYQMCLDGESIAPLLREQEKCQEDSQRALFWHRMRTILDSLPLPDTITEMSTPFTFVRALNEFGIRPKTVALIDKCVDMDTDWKSTDVINHFMHHGQLLYKCAFDMLSGLLQPVFEIDIFNKLGTLSTSWDKAQHSNSIVKKENVGKTFLSFDIREANWTVIQISIFLAKHFKLQHAARQEGKGDTPLPSLSTISHTILNLAFTSTIPWLDFIQKAVQEHKKLTSVVIDAKIVTLIANSKKWRQVLLSNVLKKHGYENKIASAQKGLLCRALDLLPEPLLKQVQIVGNEEFVINVTPSVLKEETLSEQKITLKTIQTKLNIPPLLPFIRDSLIFIQAQHKYGTLVQDVETNSVTCKNVDSNKVLHDFTRIHQVAK